MSTKKSELSEMTTRAKCCTGDEEEGGMAPATAVAAASARGDCARGGRHAEEGAESASSAWVELYAQPVAAELVGSFFFIFIGCLSVLTNPSDAGAVQPALAHGLALGLCIAVLGKLSGGHFNPAVTAGVAVVGGVNLRLVIPYWVSQLVGGMLGALLARGVVGEEAFAASSGAAFVPPESMALGRAVLAETFLSALLVLAVVMGAVNERSASPLAPFCIGFVVTVDILAGGSISGACMNPARAFGPAVVKNLWESHWVYWLGPFLGGLLIGALVRLLLGDRRRRILFK
ncbi:aquaporin-8 [Lampetra fluviatilis]